MAEQLELVILKKYAIKCEILLNWSMRINGIMIQI